MAAEAKNQPSPEESPHHEPESGSGFGWWAWIVFILFVVYPLSIGPAACFAQKYPGSERPLLAFYYPVRMLHDHTLLKQPIEKYVELWEGK